MTKRAYFRGIIKVPDERMVKKLAQMWVTGEKFPFMVETSSKKGILVNPPMEREMVKRGWVQPSVDKPYMVDQDSFQLMEVSFGGLIVVEYFLRTERLKKRKPTKKFYLDPKTRQRKGELHVTENCNDNRSRQPARV